MKCSATNTNFLADSISVDVLIKINCINFIEEKKSAEQEQAFQYFGVWKSIFSCCREIMMR